MYVFYVAVIFLQINLIFVNRKITKLEETVLQQQSLIHRYTQSLALIMRELALNDDFLKSEE